MASTTHNTTPISSASSASSSTRGVTLSFDQAIARDHREIEQAFDSYKRAAVNDKQKWANELIRLIAVHSVAEEMAVYPIEEREMGKQVADHLRSEHQEVKENLYQLERMNVTDPGYDTKLTNTMQSLLHHVKEEEKNYLPKLIAKLSREEIDSISSRFETSKTMAPTRPHPSAPDKGGVAEGMAGAMSKPLDIMMDATKEFPDKNRSGTASSTGGVSTRSMGSSSSTIKETK